MGYFDEFNYYGEENDPLFDSTDCSNNCRYDKATNMLYIGPDDGPRFAITSWESGFAFYCYDEKEAMLIRCDACDPTQNIPLFHERNEIDQAIAEYFKQLPNQFLEAAEKLFCRKAPLLKLLKLEPRALDLVTSNPALLLMLLNCIRYGKVTFEQAARLICMRRREIASACGCESSERVVKFLSKIQETRLEESDIANIARLATEPTIFTALSFLPTLPVVLLRMIQKWPKIIECAFFRKDTVFIKKLYTSDAGIYLDELYALRGDLLRVARYFKTVDIDLRLKRVEVASSIKKLHDICIERLNYDIRDNETRQYIEKRYGSVIFPEPLVPGNSSIVAIQTLGQLFEEGRLMKNCVAAYAEELKRGDCTMYRVLKPERCSLLLTKDEFGNAIITEIQLACNIRPAQQTIQAVKVWIDNHRYFQKKMVQEALAAIDIIID